MQSSTSGARRGGVSHGLDARGVGRGLVPARRVDRRAVRGVIGKESAAHYPGEPAGALQGEEIKIGAIGLRRLYDKDLPIVAGKVIKRAGAKVELRRLERGRAILQTAVRWVTVAVAMTNGGSGWGENQGPNGDVIATHFGMREPSANAMRVTRWIDKQTRNPMIPITAELRAEVLGGQAYFQHPHDVDAVLGQPQRQRPPGVKARSASIQPSGSPTNASSR